MLSKSFIAFIEDQSAQKIVNMAPVSGGSINTVYCLYTSNEKYLLKTNSKNKFPQMFYREAEGLKTITATGTIAVPKIFLQDEFEDQSFLMLEWINGGRPTPKGSTILGEQLAQMHHTTASDFGFTADNYIGSLHQSNRRHSKWSDFFIEERLLPMVNLAINKQLLDQADLKNFEQLYKNLPGLFNEEIPALIHGDLWSGNYLTDEDEKPYLIDPAVSYGHREFDIAMTTLFGGFSNEFYEAYNHTFALAKGWEQRVDLWNLYPLLVHLNLFGVGYLGQVRDCLNQFA